MEGKPARFIGDTLRAYARAREAWFPPSPRHYPLRPSSRGRGRSRCSPQDDRDIERDRDPAGHMARVKRAAGGGGGESIKAYLAPRRWNENASSRGISR
jgi:hypothetical protein